MIYNEQDFKNSSSSYAGLDNHKISQREKDANDKLWYKYHIDQINNKSFHRNSMFTLHNDFRNMKVNYDLYNNRLNKDDFAYVCKPYGEQVGELPAELTNRDIISRKIKYLEGIEAKRPFNWKLVAINEEATTRKETLKFNKIKDYVINSIMQPIQEEIQMKHQEELKGKQLSEDEKAKLQEQIQAEIKQSTPEEIKKYMSRDHQDPAEALGKQLLEYLILSENVPYKLNKGWKHGLISNREIYYTGIIGGSPKLQVINPMYFDFGKVSDSEFIEDSEWGSVEYRMTPSQIISTFKDDLTDDEIDKIYNDVALVHGNAVNGEFTFDFGNKYETGTIRVLHTVFKSLRRIGFLKYIDAETGEQDEIIVDESYKINKAQGDIEIVWRWIPELHEGYKIGTDIYIGMKPLEGQHKDITNLYECKLPFKGVVYDDMNSIATSILDRLKPYQYYYNIILYRLELLMASDKGKILLLNQNLIPQSAGIDLNKWLYYAEALKVGFLNPNEEGNKNTGQSDIVNAAKVMDMSLASDIQKYIMLADYMEQKAGETIGIPKQTEGQQSPYETASNVQSSLVQSSHILEPYFQLHEQVKKQVLTGLIEAAKVAYGFNPPEVLSYILDDESIALLKIDTDLLINSSYGLFMQNSSTAFEIKRAIEQLSHAAMQNQTVEFSDIIKVLRSTSVQEAEELLKVAENDRHEKEMEIQQQQLQAQQELEQKQQAHEQVMFDRQKELIVLKATEDRETQIQKQVILSMGFDPNKDVDGDGVPDILEVAKFGVDAQIKAKRLELDKQHLEFEKKKHKDKIEIDNKKLKKSSS